MQVACARNDPDRLMECCSRARYCFSLTSSRLRIGSIVCKRLRFPLRAARLLFVTRTQGVRRLCGETLSRKLLASGSGFFRIGACYAAV
jgi:hypothetical protein